MGVKCREHTCSNVKYGKRRINKIARELSFFEKMGKTGKDDLEQQLGYI